ncbi:MAG: hypothetical protein GY941_16710 [Planctomycetes bacterium]|nr:hypothetical protein [Planctomycetota bacterium]
MNKLDLVIARHQPFSEHFSVGQTHTQQKPLHLKQLLLVDELEKEHPQFLISTRFGLGYVLC